MKCFALLGLLALLGYAALVGISLTRVPSSDPTPTRLGNFMNSHTAGTPFGGTETPKPVLPN